MRRLSGAYENLYEARHVFRKRERDLERLDAAAARVGDMGSVKSMSAERADDGAAVQLIAGERVPDSGEVSTNLVA